MSDVRRLPVGEGIEGIAPALDELAREGARRMVAVALRAEADEYVERFSEEVDDRGYRLVVRNGRARERKVTVGSGTFPIKAPRVNDKRVDDQGERQRFSSRILPAYARRSPKVGEVIPSCICVACRPAISGRRWRACSARMPPGCLRRRSPGCALLEAMLQAYQLRRN